MPPEPLHAATTGYLDNRFQLGRTNTDAPLPTQDLPEAHDIFEANLQLKRPLFNDSHFVSVDASAFFQRGFLYYADDRGARIEVPQHSVSALRPALVLSEAYLSSSVGDHLNLLVGKKRVVWGSGQAYNPADLLNPAKDPTDPSFQRAGAWLARLEAPFESFTATFAFSTLATRSQLGLPEAFLYYPKSAAVDDEAHYLAAARLYTLVENADLSLIYFYGNKYDSAFANKSRVGVSFSRYFFTDYELHAEALLSTGSPRLYGAHDCLTSQPALMACAQGGTPLLSDSKREDGQLYPRALVGTRYLFPDESMLSAEYLYQRDGFTQQEYTDYVAALLAFKQAAALAPGATPALAGLQTGGLPQKFAFTPLRRHYAFLSYMKPKIRDDFTFNAVLIENLQDFSGLFSPSLAWSAQEWVTFTLAGLVPIQGRKSAGSLEPVSGYTEYSMMPLQWRLMFSARLFY